MPGMMGDRAELYLAWKREEELAHMIGWDFSHLEGRCSEENELPWDYAQVIKNYLSDEMTLLDMETGGGEFLLSLGHPHIRTAATEGYAPNVEYCRDVLLPLGINFQEADGLGVLPFDAESFDVVTNRHGDYSVAELQRVLKSGGLFITQQVGAENDRELVELLQPDVKDLPYPDQYLKLRVKELEDEGFRILEKGEAYRPIKFFDVGALVWFAKIIEWEFPGFEVNRYLENLYNAQAILDKEGVIEGQTHRFYIVARKM